MPLVLLGLPVIAFRFMIHAGYKFTHVVLQERAHSQSDCKCPLMLWKSSGRAQTPTQKMSALVEPSAFLEVIRRYAYRAPVLSMKLHAQCSAACGNMCLGSQAPTCLVNADMSFCFSHVYLSRQLLNA